LPPKAAALNDAERRVLAPLAAIYATRLFGLFLLLPVLALYVGGLPDGTPVLAGLAVGAYGMTQALMQIPFGTWSDRYGRRPLILAGLSLHIAGSALGWLAASAWGVVVARIVQGLGAVSGPVMALLADLTRPTARTRAMTVIGVSIGASFVLSLVAGPWLAGLMGVHGMFALIGVLGAIAMSLMLFGVPDPPARALPPPRARAGVLAAPLLPYYAGVFTLHLTLTAVFVAVPFALRDFHDIEAARHWRVYLAVFAASLALTLPLVLWSERSRRPVPLLVAGLLLVLALGALAFWHRDLRLLAAALALYFGAFNFLEARLPALLTEAAGEAARGAALGVFSTCQFAGAFAGGAASGMLLASAAGLPGVLLGAAIAALAWLPLAIRVETR